MTEIIIFALGLSLWTSGVFLFTQPGFILHEVAVQVSKLPAVIAKPLLTCLPCMSSFHGVMLWFWCSYFGAFNWNLYLLFALPMASILATIIYHAALFMVSQAELKKNVAEFYINENDEF